MADNKRIALTRKAEFTKGALTVYLRPKLAADAKLDLTSVLADLTATNFREKKAGIIAGIKQQVKGRIARDANIEGLAQLLDALEMEAAPMEAGPGVPEAHPMTGAPAVPPPAPGGGAPPMGGAPKPPMPAPGGAPGGAPPMGGAAPMKPPMPAPGAPAPGGAPGGAMPMKPPGGAPGGAPTMPIPGQGAPEKTGVEKDQGMEGGGMEQLQAFLTSKGMHPEDIAKACQMAGAGAGGGMDEFNRGSPGFAEGKDANPTPEETDAEHSRTYLEHPAGRATNFTTQDDNPTPEETDAEHSRTYLEHPAGRATNFTSQDSPPPFTGMPQRPGCANDSYGDDDMANTQKMESAVAEAAKNAIKQARDRMATSSKGAVEQERRTQREIRDAENAVRPWVGQLSQAFDSAEDIYRSALSTLGVKLEGVHPSAYHTILQLQPLPNSRQKITPTSMVVMDSKGTSDFAARNPFAAKIDIL